MGTRDTVDGLFLDAVERVPGRTFLRRLTPEGEHRRTYLDQARRVAGLVERLAARGLAPGQQVMVYADEAALTLDLTLACAHAGLVLMPVAPVFSPALARRLAERVQARAVVASAAHLRALDEAGLASLIDAAELLDAHASDPPASAALGRLRAAAGDHGPDDPYVLLPTSGTTGEPKLPLRTHAAQARRGRRAAAHIGLGPDDAAELLLAAALTHSFAHTVLAIGLASAATFLVPRAIDTATPLDDVLALEPTHVFTTPRVLRALEAQRQARPEAARAARLFGPRAGLLRLAGAAPDERLLRGVADEGVDVGESYGSSECGAVALTPRGGWRPGCVGSLLPGVEVRLAEDGELLLRVDGETVTYHGDPEQTRAALDDEGFYRTGDLATLDHGHYLRLLGRKHDLFNTAEGTNVPPQRIEERLEGLPWVRQAVLVGDQRPFFTALLVPHDEWLAADAADDLGRLDPLRAAELHARAGADLARVNAGLESIEQVRRFTLLARPLGPTLYTPVQVGKVRRARREIGQAYAAVISALYSDEAAPATCVPA